MMMTIKPYGRVRDFTMVNSFYTCSLQALFFLLSRDARKHPWSLNSSYKTATPSTAPSAPLKFAAIAQFVTPGATGVTVQRTMTPLAVPRPMTKSCVPNWVIVVGSETPMLINSHQSDYARRW
jgi:hypothetical protein